jgi:hypothetical protein
MAFRRLAKSRTLSKDGRWFEIQRERNGSKLGVANGFSKDACPKTAMRQRESSLLVVP